MQQRKKYDILIRLAAPWALALAMLAVFTWAASAQTPGGSDDPAIQQGAALYAENCAVCHGPTGQGRVGAQLNKDWPGVRPDLNVRAIIADGVPGSPMPAWSQTKGGPLSEPEIESLTAYILSWGKAGAGMTVTLVTATARPPITPLAEVQGDPNRGAALFAENCDMCHGPNGEGRVGATLAKAWPGVRPDLNVRAIISDGVPGSPMPAWSQTKGGPLSEQEIDDLTAFVLALVKASPVVQISPTAAAVGAVDAQPAGGWTSIAVFVALLAIVLAVIYWTQRRRSA